MEEISRKMMIISLVVFILSLTFMIAWNIAYSDDVALINKEYKEYTYIGPDLEQVSYKDNWLGIPCITYAHIHIFTKNLMDNYKKVNDMASSGGTIDGDTTAKYGLYTNAVKRLMKKKVDIEEKTFFKSPWSLADTALQKNVDYGIGPIVSSILLIGITVVTALIVLTTFLFRVISGEEA